MKTLKSLNEVAAGHSKALAVLLVAVMALALVGFYRPALASSTAPSSPAVTCPGGQCFADVPSSSPFYSYINNLYIDGIVTGYACNSTPSEPCDSASRPYYRPGNNVSRAQMAKFVDLGRRNIAYATGVSLSLSSPASGFLASAFNAQCINSGCISVVGIAPAGSTAALLTGGSGVYAGASDANSPAVSANSSGTGSSPAVLGTSTNSIGVRAKTNNAGSWSLYVDSAGSSTTAGAAAINGGLYVAGNMTVTGSKTGYVVDLMQNAGSDPLEVGDVVEIVGNSAPVLGEIPVVTVRKASKANSTAVVGVVDQAVYVPSASLKAQYEAQKRDQDAALAQRQELLSKGDAASMAKAAAIKVPDVSISDKAAVVQPIDKTSGIGTGEYANVVTLGSFKAVKVDASYGAIQPGDLLVSSPHAGYAMKAGSDGSASGAVIGKALGGLSSGTGTVPVIVTLK